MGTKEYYKSLMAVIEYVGNGHRDIAREKGQELSGRYWPRIYETMKNLKIGSGDDAGCFYVTKPQRLDPLYEDCIHAIKELEEAEMDRALDRASKYAGIKYARFAFVVSLIALAVSLATLVWQVIG